MKILMILSLALAAALSAKTSEVQPLFIGGENAVPGEFPYMVSMQLWIFGQAAHFCGGIIIGSIWVLTGAFCITNLPNLGFIEAWAGRHNLALFSEPGQSQHSVITRFIHPGFNIVFGRNDPHDLALIRTVSAIPITDRIRPIALPASNSPVPNGPFTFPTWAGIGIGATLLQKATLFSIPLGVCQDSIRDLNFQGNIFNDTNFCTGPLNGQVSVCAGSSGGPMIQGVAPNEVLVGMASWGVTPCGTNGAPSGVFTRLSAYNDWITSVTGIS